MERNGLRWQAYYCPANGFGERDNDKLWNFSPGKYRIVGYAMTLPGTTSLAETNWNQTPFPWPAAGAGVVPPEPPAERVLLADVTISRPGQTDEINRRRNTYLNIAGGYEKPFRTSHIAGSMPVGGGVCMLDGHVEWRRFDDIRVRTVGTSSPVFWW